MKENRTVAGIPVSGPLSPTKPEDKTQRPKAEFDELARAVLVMPGLDYIHWTQYTPYWADGEECEFSADRFAVVLTGDTTAYPRDEEYYDWLDEAESMTTAGKCARYGQYAQAVHDLYVAVIGGTFDRVLLDLFGDHAIVDIFPDHAIVEFFHHD